MRKITAVFLAVLMTAVVLLSQACNASRAYAMSLSVKGHTHGENAGKAANWLEPAGKDLPDGSGLFNSEEIYNKEQIKITLNENNEPSVEVRAEEGDVIEYYLANGSCVVDGGALTVGAGDITEGIYSAVISGLLVPAGENIFTVVRKRNGESIRNGISFNYNPIAPFSSTEAEAPNIFWGGAEGEYRLSWGETLNVNIYRSENGVDYLLLARADGTEYTDETRDETTTYYYAVKAVSGTDLSGYSNVLEIKRAPKSVTGLSVTDAENGKKLSWNPSNGAEWYAVTATVDGEEKSANVVGTSCLLTGENITGISVEARNSLNLPETERETPAANDADNDGLSDAEEEQLGTNPHDPDSDGDGLTDGFELTMGTNPLKRDTDGDGTSDGAEAAPKVYYGSEDGRDLYIVEKDLGHIQDEKGGIRVGIIGGTELFGAALAVGKNNNFTAQPKVAAAIDLHAQNAKRVELTFDLTEVETFSGKENLRLFYINENGRLELVESTLTGNVLTATAENSGTYVLADKSVQTETVVLIEKQYYYSYRYKKYYCDGHTEAYCPGHLPVYACVVHPQCNGGRLDCIVRVPFSESDLIEETSHMHSEDHIYFEDKSIQPNVAPREYCDPPCSTRTTYCSGCSYRWATMYIDGRTDGTYKEIDVALGLTESLFDDGYYLGIAQNTSDGVKSVFGTMPEEKLSTLNGMKNYYGSSTQGASLSNAVGMFTGQYVKRIIYIRLNGSPSTLKTQIQNAYANGIQTDVISMFKGSDSNQDALIAAAQAGGGGYYGVDTNLNAEALANRIEEIYQSLSAVWETEEWVYGGGRKENRQMSFSDLYAGTENREANEWMSTASANLLTGGYTAQSADILNYGGAQYLNIIRTYNSLSGGKQGYFGNGYAGVFDAKAEYINDNTKALVKVPSAELFVTQGGEAAGYISKGTEVKLLDAGGEYSKVSYDDAEYFVNKADLHIGGWYSVTLPAGGAEKFIDSGGLKPLSPFGSFELDRGGAKYVYTSKDKTVYSFDESGRITEIRDKNGEKMAFAYSVGKITVSDIYGNTVEAAVSGGKITSITHAGKTVSYRYDGKGNLTEADWFGERKESYAYHYITGLLTEIKDASGKTLMSFDYDMLGRIRNKYTNFDQSRTSREAFVYDNLSSAVYAVKANGTRLKITYNAFLEPTSEIYIDGGGAEHVLWEKEYYFFDGGEWLNYTSCIKDDEIYLSCLAAKNGKAAMKEVKTERFDANGAPAAAATATEFDGRGNVTKVTDANGSYETFEYDGLDNLTRHTDKAGYATVYEYDGVDLIRKTDALSRATVYEYYTDAPLAHKVKKITYPSGETAGYAYDEKGNAVSETKSYLSEQSVVTREYYPDGKLKKTTDANGNAAEYTYTAFGETASVSDAVGARTFAYDNNGRLAAETDENGVVTRYERYLDGKLKTKRVTAGGETLYREDYSYDIAGNLIRKETEGGAATEYAYDYAGRVVAEREVRQDASGGDVTRVKINEYDYAGLLTKTADYMGNVTEYSYDLVKNLVKTEELNPDGNRATLFEYDENGRAVRTTYASGAFEQTAYDALGRAVSQTNKAGGVKTFVYGDADNSVTVTDENGGVTKEYRGLSGVVRAVSVNVETEERATLFVYDQAGNLVEKTLPNGLRTVYAYDSRNRNTSASEYGGDTLLASATKEYDAVNNLTKETLPDGLVRQYGYDALRRNTSVTLTDEGRYTTVYAYDADGRLIGSTDALGGQTVISYAYSAEDYLTVTTTNRNGASSSAVYDRLDRVVKQTDALGSETSSYYDAFGNLTAVVSGERSTQFGYDIMGNNTSATDARGNTTAFAFDLTGRMTQKTNADGGVISYAYDALGNVLAATDAKGGVTTYRYDAFGNKIKTIDALGNVTAFGYDAMNNLVCETNALGGQKTYAYDLRGNLASVTEGGLTYTYEYDAMGRLAAASDPAGGTKSYRYDRRGNPVKATDESGAFESCSYDALNRVLSKTDRNGLTTVYEYDAVGNLVKETAPDGVTEYVYDAANRVVEVKENSVSAQNISYTRYGEVSSADYGGYRVEYLYDAFGNKIKTQFLGEQVLYTYDEMNRVKTVESNGVTAAYTYDLNGNTAKAETGAVSAEYEFNALNLPVSQTNRAGTSTEINTYAYDALGRVTDKNENGLITSYAYDGLGRLSAVTEGERVTEYSYDVRSNRVGKTVTEGEAALAESYAYGQNGRLLTLTSNGIQSNFAYDLNGNQTGVTKGSETESYVYDSKNRLVSSGINGTENTYSYYPGGLRKTKDGAAYIYDGKNILAEITDENVRLNVYGNALLFTVEGTVTVDGEEISVSGKIAYAYGFNLHGDVVRVLSVAGLTLNSYRYDAFGVIVGQTEAVANTFYYSGYEYDSETGLYYLRSRYYNPETARFLTEDSFSGRYNDPLSLNKYTYCHNNPVSYHDPDGFAINRMLLMTDGGGGGIDPKKVLEETLDRIDNETAALGWLMDEVDKLLNSKAAKIFNDVFKIKDKDTFNKLRLDAKNLSDSVNKLVTDEGMRDIIKQDLVLINYDMYNSDPEKVLKAQAISYYNGQLVVKTDLGLLNNRSFSFAVMYLSKTEENNAEGINTVKHEYGHYVQLQELGWEKYIQYIAIPSMTSKERDNYYSQPWERTADMFGDVYRGHYLENSLKEAIEYFNDAKSIFPIIPIKRLIGILRDRNIAPRYPGN